MSLTVPTDSSDQELGGNPKLHHIGFVVDSIDVNARSIAWFTGTSWDGRIVTDPNQMVRVAFLHACGFGSACPLIELVEPDGDRSPVSKFVERGWVLHHLCYEVDDLDDRLARCREIGGMVVKPPLPAEAFESRRIGWVYTKQKLLLEFLER